MINTLADNALFAAFLGGRDRVTNADVERAHEDLGWPAAESGGGVAAVPEFVDESESTLEVEAPPPVEMDATILLTEAHDAGNGGLNDLDAELDAVFAATGRTGIPDLGPPKDEEQDLVATLLED